jgi:hypothetical protein
MSKKISAGLALLRLRRDYQLIVFELARLNAQATEIELCMMRSRDVTITKEDKETFDEEG